VAMDKTCAECGYLTIRHRKSRELVEVETGIREGGKIPALEDETNTGAQPVYEKPFLCFMREPQLTADMQSDDYPSYEDRCNSVFHRLRECDSWVKWDQGFTPKEHVVNTMLKEQRDWQRDTDARNNRWRVLELVVMGGIVTLISVAAQIGAAFIERDSPAPQMPQSIQLEWPKPEPRLDRVVNAD